jgi:undecaprenyl-diphosphatase
MAFFYLLTLALVQGLTEFLPISSSGHLVLVHAAFGGVSSWEKHMLLDVSVHIGTLCSVLVYFHRDVFAMFRGLMDSLKGDYKSEGARMNGYVLVSSIPVIVAGYILHVIQPSWLLSIKLVAWSTLIFGVLLWVVDSVKPVRKERGDMTFTDALIIGCAQALALIPGTSRSGITMTASRFLGYSRTEAARYSLLLAIIAIGGAGVLGMIDLAQQGDIALGIDVFIMGFLAFVSGLVAIALMMKWLSRSTFMPFALYRVILGAGLLILLYGGFIT